MQMIRAAFTKYPILSNSVVYGLLYVGAEFSQQTLTRKIFVKGQPAAYDHHTITRFGILGVTFYQPVFYYWYRWLDSKYIGTAKNIVFKKLLLDQFVFTPPLLAAFFVLMSIMERQDDVFHECKAKWVPTFEKSCMFWLPAQTINFMFIPATFRVVYIGCCAFAWVNILCWIKKQRY